MEKLTTNNVEAWMLDYQEGNLSDERINELLAFLKSHSELSIDPDFSDFMTLEAPELTYPGKADLFRTDLNLPELSEDEIECIARIEGDLIHVEEKIFDASIEANTKKAILFQTLKQTILEADSNITFENKAGLHRRRIQIPLYVYSLISAVAIIVFGWFIFFPDTPVQELPVLANDTTPQLIFLNKLVHPSKFDKIATTDPVKRMAVSNISITESITNTESVLVSLLPARKLPLRLLNPSSVVPDKSNAFIYRALPYPGDIEYQTFLAYTGDVLRERILGQDPEFVKKTQFSFWELADAGIDKVSNFLSLPVDLDREYNDDGKLESVVFDSRLVAFSTPIHVRK